MAANDANIFFPNKELSRQIQLDLLHSGKANILEVGLGRFNGLTLNIYED